MAMQTLVIVGFAIGAGLLVHGLGALFIEAVSHLWYRVHKRGSAAERLLALYGQAPVAQKTIPFDPAGNIPWTQVYLISLALVALLFGFTRQNIVFLLAVLPMAVRLWITQSAKKKMDEQVWQFLLDVRIRLPLQGSLLRALEAVAQEEKTWLAQYLHRILGHGFQGDGLQTLERLAQDTDAPYLADVVARAKAAQDGTMGLDAALRQSLERVQAEISTTARVRLQEIPNRLIVLAFPLLLGPGVVALLYPLAARVLSGIQGVSWSGSF